MKLIQAYDYRCVGKLNGYLVDPDTGDMYSTKKNGKPVKLTNNSKCYGWRLNNLYIDGIGRRAKIRARIVWQSINGPIPEGLEIDHINRIRDDDRGINLRAVTHIENMQNSSSTKYSEELLMQIFTLKEQGFTHREITKKLGIKSDVYTKNVYNGFHRPHLRERWLKQRKP